MPRYFFHVHDGQSTPDTDGVVLRDDAEARYEAKVTSSRLLFELGDELWSGEPWHMEVIDDSGRRVCCLSVRGHLQETDERRF